MQAVSGEIYDFQAKPQVVHSNAKQKYRETNNEGDDDKVIRQNIPLNIMFDKKVVRGNTYAASVISKNQDKERLKKESILFKKPNVKQQVHLLHHFLFLQQVAFTESSCCYKFRKNMESQTEEYVETLMDRPPESDIEIQTDFYIDKPPERLFVPRKYGIDKESQIWEGELFDFDLEVQPILQVLMNKTLEQGRMEVLEEEEMKLMKQQQKQFEKTRNAELVEMQRLEAVQKRLDSDEQRRRLQYNIYKQQAIFSHEKLICRLIAKDMLKNFKSNTFRMLKDMGVFRDPLVSSIQGDFSPWLYEQITEELNKQEEIRYELNQFMDSVSQQNKQTHRQTLDDENKRKMSILDDRSKVVQEKKLQKQRRKEQRKRLQEQKERDKMRDNLLVEFRSKGEVKQAVPPPDNENEFQSTMKQVSEIFTSIQQDSDISSFNELFIQQSSDIQNTLLQLFTQITQFVDYQRLSTYLLLELHAMSPNLEFIVPQPHSNQLLKFLLSQYFSPLIQIAVDRKLREFSQNPQETETLLNSTKIILEQKDELQMGIQQIE